MRVESLIDENGECQHLMDPTCCSICLNRTPPKRVSVNAVEPLVPQDITFPRIYDIICEYGQSDFISGAKLEQMMLEDAELAALFHHAAFMRDRTALEESTNALAWFGQTWTEGKNPYQHDLERIHEDGRYAYRTKEKVS